MAKILLVEDDPHAREMLKFRFEKAGYEVVEALDGDEGLMKALRQPDLVVLDIRLPKIDGWELCRMLKTEPRTRHIPILMLTGCSQPVQEEYGKHCGADGYITKPWDPRELMSITERLIQESKPDDV